MNGVWKASSREVAPGPLGVIQRITDPLDCHIGAVIKALPPAVAENTVKVFLSDHGEYASAHGFVAGKVGTCYEEICKVPLIVVDPTGRFTSGLTPSLGTHGRGC